MENLYNKQIILYSYGVNHPRPRETYYANILDCQRLPNPDEYLWQLTGVNSYVRQNILQQISANKKLIKHFNYLWRTAIGIVCTTKQPLIAWRCFGGKHRSVTMCEEFKTYLQGLGYTNIHVQHLHINHKKPAVKKGKKVHE